VFREPHGSRRYAPDGLAGEVLDELIDRTYAEVPTPLAQHQRCWMGAQLSSVDAGLNAERWLRWHVHCRYVVALSTRMGGGSRDP
jgi:hypothetical protein